MEDEVYFEWLLIFLFTFDKNCVQLYEEGSKVCLNLKIENQAMYISMA